MRSTRRGVLGAIAALTTVGMGGCLTVQPTLSTGPIADSAVFKRITAADWLADTHLAIDVELTPAATDPAVGGVKSLAVVGHDGTTDWTSTLTPGTVKKKATVRTDEPSLLLALAADATPVDQVDIRVRGVTIP